MTRSLGLACCLLAGVVAVPAPGRADPLAPVPATQVFYASAMLGASFRYSFICTAASRWQTT